jgi:hypothetical protein
MKRPIVFSLLLGWMLLACQFLQPTPAQPPAPSPTPILEGDDWGDRSVFRAGLVESARPILDDLAGASMYRIALTIEDDIYHISGSEEVRYTNTEEVALDEVRFRLFPNILGGEMNVTEVLVNEQSVTPAFSLEDSLMSVTLATALEPGDSATLQIEFMVTVPKTLDLNYGVLAYAEDVLALAHAYPMIAVYDDEGWNAEIPPQSGDVTYADMSFFLVEITAPEALTLVATGRELSRSVEGREQRVSYASGPARDFYLTASPDYELFTRQAGEVTIRFYASKDQEAGAEAGLDVAVSSLENFTARYAPYPYTELDLVSTPTQALGIEYPGMIAITSHIIAPNDYYLEATMAHEVAHQWFYNLIGNDQLDDPWLDESLAQWATLQYFSDEYGPDGLEGFRSSLTGRWERADGELIPIGLPVADYSGGEYSAIVYGRGPLFFEALKQELGGQTFDGFMKKYVETYAWRVSTPEGLKDVAEAECGCDLTSLFEDWVYP